MTPGEFDRRLSAERLEKLEAAWRLRGGLLYLLRLPNDATDAQILEAVRLAMIVVPS